jgi:uncharacterized protein (DUF302 family)
MAEENATSTYVIAEPFDLAVRLVRKVLAEASLKITGEMNMSGRIQRALWIQTAPCLVLFASPAAFAAEPDAAGLTPLHIVISARGEQTDVHVLKVLPRDSEVSSRLKAAIAEAIETIGMRVGPGAW